MAAAAGSAGIITVPKTTTSATVVTSSRLRAFTTPSTAAAAAAPQIEKLHAISSRCVQPSPSILSQRHRPGDTPADHRNHHREGPPPQRQHVRHQQLQTQQRHPDAQQPPRRDRHPGLEHRARRGEIRDHRAEQDRDQQRADPAEQARRDQRRRRRDGTQHQPGQRGTHPVEHTRARLRPDRRVVVGIGAVGLRDRGGTQHAAHSLSSSSRPGHPAGQVFSTWGRIRLPVVDRDLFHSGHYGHLAVTGSTAANVAAIETGHAHTDRPGRGSPPQGLKCNAPHGIPNRHHILSLSGHAAFDTGHSRVPLSTPPPHPTIDAATSARPTDTVRRHHAHHRTRSPHRGSRPGRPDHRTATTDNTHPTAPGTPRPVADRVGRGWTPGAGQARNCWRPRTNTSDSPPPPTRVCWQHTSSASTR